MLEGNCSLPNFNSVMKLVWTTWYSLSLTKTPILYMHLCLKTRGVLHVSSCQKYASFERSDRPQIWLLPPTCISWWLSVDVCGMGVRLIVFECWQVSLNKTGIHSDLNVFMSFTSCNKRARLWQYTALRADIYLETCWQGYTACSHQMVHLVHDCIYSMRVRE